MMHHISAGTHPCGLNVDETGAYGAPPLSLKERGLRGEFVQGAENANSNDVTPEFNRAL